MIEEKEMPLVSVVVPCYNHEKYVKETIESIINQTYKNIELIVIDDGSKDNSVSVIQELADKYGFTFIHRANKGLSATLNEALKWCNGQYVSFIASDDIMRTYKIEEQVEYLEKYTETIGVFGAVEVLYKNGYKKEIVANKKSYSFDDIFLHKHNLPAPTSMIRIENIKKIGGFREDFIIEDWVMWLDLTKDGGKLDYLDRVFASYRRHDGNLSGQFDKMFIGRMQTVEAFKDRPNYKQAKAKALFSQANDVQTVDKLKSLIYAKEAVITDINLFFTISFVKYIVKLFIFRKGKLN